MEGSDKLAASARVVKRVTWIGMGVNVLLSIAKITAGLYGASQAVVADGVHSMSDLATDIAVLIGVRYWSAPADDCHPHGHQRIETAVTAFIGIALALVAVLLGYRAMATLHEQHNRSPDQVALVAALVSIAVKEILYRWTYRAGRKINSAAVRANAWHHRSDALSSIPATLAVAGAMIRPSWYFLDHVGAIVVSVFILQASWKILSPALRELTDAGAPAEVIEQLESLAMSMDGVRAVHKIRTRHLGGGIQVILHVLVDGQITVEDGHAIAGRVRERLLQQGPDVTDVITHIEPFEEHP